MVSPPPPGPPTRHFTVAGRRCGALRFDPAEAGAQGLQRLLADVVVPARAREPWTPWYLWACAPDAARYLAVARGFDVFYPHPERPTPPPLWGLLDQLGEAYFPGDYDGDRGTVRRSAPAAAPLSERSLQDPLVRFFADMNPHHGLGHGLLLVCPMTVENLVSFLRRRAVDARPPLAAARPRG